MSAKSRVNTPPNPQRRTRAANPAEQSVDVAEQEKAMRLIQMLANGGQQQYKPILKSLKEIGITPVTMPVMLGDEPKDCLVIPVDQLMGAEWKHMSGMDEDDV